MAAHTLTKTLKPWTGPKTVALPEDYGFIPNSTAPATVAIQAAVDALAAQGGGTVRLTVGDYVSGTIELRSNIRLEVSKGARLLGSLSLSDYPEKVAARKTVMDSNMGMNQSLIFAEGVTNISVAGDGIIDGRGSKANFPGKQTVGTTPGRPFLIRVIDCKKVHIVGIRLHDAACWMQNYLNCEDLLIEDIFVSNQANFNNDGLDIDGCRRVIVRNSIINSEDDAMCFKGASQRPMEDVLVENCQFYTSCNAIKFGTDSQGDFRRILVRNVTIGGTPAHMPAINRRTASSGITWAIVDGGTLEDVYVHDARIFRSKSPLYLRLGDRGRVRPEDPVPAPGTMRRIVFENISGKENDSRGSYFLGIADRKIEDVVLKNVHLWGAGSASEGPDESEIDQMRKRYPDAQNLKLAPAYGLWARHVRRLTLINVDFVVDQPDPRPKILTKTDVDDVVIA
ncbi:hypothetical protein HMP06_0300 [Sphingomonas sp. HMP6]|nr:hypothetical protein HMP06_0300 [Sphingomonas sp. HMP6]